MISAAKKCLRLIIELTKIEELYHDGVQVEIRQLAERALKEMKGGKK